MTGENVVEVDQAQLAAEAAAVDVPDVPAPAGDPGAADLGGGQADALTIDQAAAMAASYEAGAFILLSQASKIVAPNWRVTDAENRDLAKVTATALALWFPDQQLPPKYAALLALAGCVYGIAESRRDPATGRIRPLRELPPEDDARQGSLPLDMRPAPAGGGAFFGGAPGGAG